MPQHHPFLTPQTSPSSNRDPFEAPNSFTRSSQPAPRFDSPGASRKTSPRSSARPSSAPTKERPSMLPSLPSSRTMTSTQASRSVIVENIPERSDLLQLMQTVKEDETDALSASSLAIAAPLEVEAEVFLSPSQTEVSLSSSHSDYDWEAFITAYAAGLWDPHRTPNPPRSSFSSSDFISTSADAPLSIPIPAEAIGSDVIHGQSHSQLLPDYLQTYYDSQTTNSQSPAVDQSSDTSYTLSSSTCSFPVSPPSPSSPRSAAPAGLRLPVHRMRSSFSASSAPLPSPGDLVNPPSGSAHANAEVQANVATLRWAAARVDISPLALPSPERELTDPMHGVTASIPGSHPTDFGPGPDHPATPAEIRKSRLASFWHGTTDIDEQGSQRNEPHLRFQGTNTSSGFQTPQPSRSISSPSAKPEDAPIASVSQNSLHHTNELLTSDDYFGSAVIPVDPSSERSQTQASSFRDDVSSIIVPPSSKTPEPSITALPRRVCLTRQTSSPLPNATNRESILPGGRIAPDNTMSIKAGRAAKEEQMFAELGYLAPPNAPNELERRRALYKFNIWNTGADLNFDRIAHLAKLVFNTKGVVISLIDGNEQWHKSEWGIKFPSSTRAHSFCAHVILQQGDEPMVILDTHTDWRFAKNPLVIGAPHIRFYAGAPLRTSDGFNIGTLAVIDDTPHDDFPPRQKHTLKEFAAIAMREMELWRDKIQLRIRDRIQNSMEQFSRECLEIDTEAHAPHADAELDYFGSSMDKVYDRAAKLVKRTLDVEGVIVMDVLHRDVLETINTECSISVIMHFGDPQLQATKRQLSTEEYNRLNTFFSKYPDGKISEGIVPQSFRPFLPNHIQYALTVPIFNIDKRPFALLCAYNVSDQSKRYLEGHELSYLRAIGVIILSAVLKRRMILADKAKSLFISNISHELRTPLHGILAAAELLGESRLTHAQLSFLQTVQACGTSLVETVNHVLDFTKLSGNSKAGGVENIITPSKVDLMQLIEEAVDGCWIGHRARSAVTGESVIGSVYSPPKEVPSPSIVAPQEFVETVVDVAYRPQGWTLKCEKGGIRRVLMNLFGNSLKFTKDGYIHVVLRELPISDSDPKNRVKVELSVIDTGKGISQNFLKNQLFHPFSQENPLQTGTGLGLAIVNSILTSESVRGKVEVWSEEGAGTEIKATFLAEKIEEREALSPDMEPFKFDDLERPPSATLVGFDGSHQGTRLLGRVIANLLESWWGFDIYTGPGTGDIIILNDDFAPIKQATARRDVRTPFIILSAARGSPSILDVASEHERIGGFCRILFKPSGPSRLRAILKLALHAHKISSRSSRGTSPNGSIANGDELSALSSSFDEKRRSTSSVLRRKSEENNAVWPKLHPLRPQMSLRSMSAHPTTTWQNFVAQNEQDMTCERDTVQTVSVGPNGSLLKSSVGALESAKRRCRVLVVEDNSILRSLLIKWLSQKGYDFRSANDGREGVTVYESEGPFDVVLVDLSMPVLDGIAATSEIRSLESKVTNKSHSEPNTARRSCIIALTGMSSLEDKRRAFEAGVDGYLVKPVAFKTLDEMFRKMGI